MLNANKETQKSKRIFVETNFSTKNKIDQNKDIKKVGSFIKTKREAKFNFIFNKILNKINESLFQLLRVKY